MTTIKDETIGIRLSIAAVIVVVYVFAMVSCNHDCESRGGSFVMGGWGLPTCVEKK